MIDVDDGYHAFTYIWVQNWGPSMVKWTTSDPYLVLSESDSNLYTDFEFCIEKNHRHWENIYWYTKPSSLWWQKVFQEILNILHCYIEDGASGVQVGDIEQAIIKKNVYNTIKLDEIDGSL